MWDDEGSLRADGPLVGDRWLPQQASFCDVSANLGFERRLR